LLANSARYPAAGQHAAFIYRPKIPPYPPYLMAEIRLESIFLCSAVGGGGEQRYVDGLTCTCALREEIYHQIIIRFVR
jgi:hypothetical protein